MKMLDQAQALAQAGRIKEADALYQKLLGKQPVGVKVLQTAITFHNRYSRFPRKAVPIVEALLKARPKLAVAHCLAAETFTNCKRFPVAKAHAAQSIALSPDDPDILFIAAYAHLQAGDFDPALGFIDHALQMRPGHRPAQLQKGRALLGLGNVAEAADVARALWQEQPDDINAIGLFVDAAKVEDDDPILIHMRDALLPKYETIGGQTLSHLLKLLGKAHNDFGDYYQALRYFHRAKAAAPMKYDVKGYAHFVNTLRNGVSRTQYVGKGMDNDCRILIVGMPRSGSTLLEQVLVGHPDIASAGESTSLNTILQEVGVRTHNGDRMVRAIKEMPAAAATRLAERYLQETAQGDAPYVIDKSLHNFELLGFFAGLLPKTRVIHVSRDPMDTCVSCYMQSLSAWHRYTQSFDTLGHAYVLYRRLMDHWKVALPNPIMDVAYEDLVNDLEPTARRVFDFLGCDWDSACLDFQNADNRSLTLSARQVREPLYKTSMQRWRRYEDDLEPLKKRLQPLYPNGFDAPATLSM